MVYTHLDQTDLHEVLLNSEHFTDFVQFLVSGKKMDRLLMKSLRAGRVQEAIQLVEMYNREHSITTTGGVGKNSLEVSTDSCSVCITDITPFL